jgi:hypothetical protein
VSIPDAIRDDVVAYLSIRPQDDDAPLPIGIDGAGAVPIDEGGGYVELQAAEGKLRLGHEIVVPNGRHRAALDFYLPWSSFPEPVVALAPDGTMPAPCEYGTEAPVEGCAPACLAHANANGAGERLLLARVTGAILVEPCQARR